jgi:hypothetical protein
VEDAIDRDGSIAGSDPLASDPHPRHNDEGAAAIHRGPSSDDDHHLRTKH